MVFNNDHDWSFHKAGKKQTIPPTQPRTGCLRQIGAPTGFPGPWSRQNASGFEQNTFGLEQNTSALEQNKVALVQLEVTLEQNEVALVQLEVALE